MTNILKTKNLSVITPILLEVIIIFLASCSYLNPTENPNKQTNKYFTKYENVITESELENKIEIVNIYKTHTHSGLLNVRVILKGKPLTWWDSLWYGNLPYKIAYKFTWFDKSGMEVPNITNTWREVEVPQGNNLSVSSVAPSLKCKNFILRIHKL